MLEMIDHLHNRGEGFFIMVVEDLVNPDSFRFPLDNLAIHLTDAVCAPQSPVGVFSDQDAGVALLPQALQAGGEVHAVADAGSIRGVNSGGLRFLPSVEMTESAILQSAPKIFQLTFPDPASMKQVRNGQGYQEIPVTGHLAEHRGHRYGGGDFRLALYRGLSRWAARHRSHINHSPLAYGHNCRIQKFFHPGEEIRDRRRRPRKPG